MLKVALHHLSELGCILNIRAVTPVHYMELKENQVPCISDLMPRAQH